MTRLVTTTHRGLAKLQWDLRDKNCSRCLENIHQNQKYHARHKHHLIVWPLMAALGHPKAIRIERVYL